MIAIGYFGYGYYKSSTEVKETVRTATVEYGHLSDSISATGSLSAVDNVDISSKITGRIVEVCVEENDHVNAGQVLVRLDDTSLAATQTQMQAKMENALATYNRYSALLAKGAISNLIMIWQKPIIQLRKQIMTRLPLMLMILSLLHRFPVMS